MLTWSIGDEARLDRGGYGFAEVLQLACGDYGWTEMDRYIICSGWAWVKVFGLAS